MCMPAEKKGGGVYKNVKMFLQNIIYIISEYRADYNITNQNGNIDNILVI